MVDEREIQDIIERVRRRVGSPDAGAGRRMAVQAELAAEATAAVGDGVFVRLDEAVAAAAAAFRSTRLELDQRKVIIEAVRRAALDQAETLARLAVEETGASTTRPPRTGSSPPRHPGPRTSRSRRCPAPAG